MSKRTKHSNRFWTHGAAEESLAWKQRICNVFQNEGSMTPGEAHVKVKPFKTMVELLLKMTDEEFAAILEREAPAPFKLNQ